MAKDNKEQKKTQQQPVKYTVKEYLIINGFFWAFLLVVSIAVFFAAGGKWDPVMKSVFTFIFLVFGLGFSAVSVFDYVYDRAAKSDETGG
ncbi:MAG TPA: hypothetical protein ENN43_08055 [bacterium]|nr:hypothetical protein [bacterium]